MKLPTAFQTPQNVGQQKNVRITLHLGYYIWADEPIIISFQFFMLNSDEDCAPQGTFASFTPVPLTPWGWSMPKLDPFVQKADILIFSVCLHECNHQSVTQFITTTTIYIYVSTNSYLWWRWLIIWIWFMVVDTVKNVDTSLWDRSCMHSACVDW